MARNFWLIRDRPCRHFSQTCSTLRNVASVLHGHGYERTALVSSSS